MFPKNGLTEATSLVSREMREKKPRREEGENRTHHPERHEKFAFRWKKRTKQFSSAVPKTCRVKQQQGQLAIG